MTKNNFGYVVSFVFLVVGVMHALRLLYGWEVQMGSLVMPMWASWAGVIVAFYLAYQGFQLFKKA